MISYLYAVSNFIIDYKVYLLKISFNNIVRVTLGGFIYLFKFKIKPYPNSLMTIEEDIKKYSKNK